MSAPSARDMLAGLQLSLLRRNVDYEQLILEFGQVAASEDRASGRAFSFRDHVRGLLLSQLSSQRPWGPIAANEERIREIFLDYDPDALERAEPMVLVDALCRIRCGNRALRKQLIALRSNITRLRLIEAVHGTLDAFVTSADPDAIARSLSEPGEHKLGQIGYPLAMEYLKNVGIRAGKPDTHVRRALGSERLGFADGFPSEREAYEILARLADEAGCNRTYFDNLLWLFCAQDYGDICGASPRCAVCALANTCNYPAAVMPNNGIPQPALRAAADAGRSAYSEAHK